MELQKKALGDCLLHARSIFEGDLTVELVEAIEEWDPTLQRNVLDQSMLVKRLLHELEIITNDAGMLAGFIDHSQWQDGGYRPIETNQLMAIGMATGWLTTTAQAISTCQQGQNGEAYIEIELSGSAVDNKFRAGFNTATLKLIYLIPNGVDPYV